MKSRNEKSSFFPDPEPERDTNRPKRTFERQLLFRHAGTSKEKENAPLSLNIRPLTHVSTTESTSIFDTTGKV